MPLSFAGSGQGIEWGLLRSINAVMEHVHSLYCDSRQPASFPTSLLKAVALEWASTRVKQGSRSQFTFCCLTCEKYFHRTIESSRLERTNLQIIQSPTIHPALHPLNHKASPGPWSCWSWGGVEPHLEMDVFTLFPPLCFPLAAPGSGCFTQKLCSAPWAVLATPLPGQGTPAAFLPQHSCSEIHSFKNMMQAHLNQVLEKSRQGKLFAVSSLRSVLWVNPLGWSLAWSPIPTPGVASPTSWALLCLTHGENFTLICSLQIFAAWFCPCPLCLLLKLPVSRSNPQSLSFFSSLNPVMINCFSCFELSVERVPVLFPRMQHHQHFSIIQIGFRLSSCPSPWKELLTLALPLVPLTLMWWHCLCRGYFQFQQGGESRIHPCSAASPAMWSNAELLSASGFKINPSTTDKYVKPLKDLFPGFNNILFRNEHLMEFI